MAVPQYWAHLVDYQAGFMGGAGQGSNGGVAGLPIAKFESNAGKTAPVVGINSRWLVNGVSQAFPLGLMNDCYNHGRIPSADWGVWDITSGGETNNRLIAYDHIITGATSLMPNGATIDSYITTWATAAKNFGHPFFLRIFHEMNLTGNTFGTSSGSHSWPWLIGSVTAGGITWTNTIAQHIGAWQHIYNIFQSVGATNATFVWCPNVRTSARSGSGTFLYSDFFPGAAYVHWLGLDGYTGAANQPWAQIFRGPTAGYPTFADSYAEIVALDSSLPLAIMETGVLGYTSGVSDRPGRATTYTNTFSTDIPAMSRLALVKWFMTYYDATMWTPDLDGAGTNNTDMVAFRNGIASSNYINASSFTYPPDLTPIVPYGTTGGGGSVAERQPVVASDVGTWGTVLNGYLSVDHDATGQHTSRGRTWESFGGAVGGSAATQSAAWTAARAWLVTNGGGSILFGTGTYANMPAMELPGRTQFEGLGHRATRLVANASINANWITNHVSTNGTTDPNAEFIILRNLMLDGNKANQTAGHVIFFSTLPISGTAASSDDDFDTHHVFENLFIYNAKSGGIVETGRSSSIYTNVQAYFCDGNGISPTYDTIMNNCVTGQAGLRGFTATGTNLRVVGCDAFYSGNVTASSGHGFYVQSLANGILTFVGCLAQDNRASGVTIDTCRGVSWSGGGCDSNSFATPGTYPGVDLFNASDCYVQSDCVDRQGQGSTVGTTQTTAIRVRTACVRNTIDIKHWAAVTGGTGTFTNIADPVLQWDTDCTPNNVTIMGCAPGYGGYQTQTFAASFTPTPMQGNTIQTTMTANLTALNAPPAGQRFQGQSMRLIFTQDATGGRTITGLNAIYRPNTLPAVTTTANTRTQVTYCYIGAQYVMTDFRTGDAI